MCCHHDRRLATSSMVRQKFRVRVGVVEIEMGMEGESGRWKAGSSFEAVWDVPGKQAIDGQFELPLYACACDVCGSE